MSEKLGAALAGEVKPAKVATPFQAKRAGLKEGATVEEVAEAAAAEIAAMTDKPPPHLKGQKARRPTKAEVAEFPHRFAGPNVWVVENDPPKPNGFGSFVRLEVFKFAANGHGWPSILLVGTRGNRNPDKEALGAYRPFRVGLGAPLPGRGGPDGGKRKAA
jgi:hypothetical protein